VLGRAGLALVAVALITACAPLIAEPGPRRFQPGLTAHGIRAADGAVLPMRVWRPDGPPQAVILALHGFNDYGNFFAEPGAYLAQRGVFAYAYDQRGFGAAPGRGLWPGRDAMVRDLADAVTAVRARHPGTPLYLLGESMGGAVIMAAMTRDTAPRADGVILAAPAVWGRATMPFYQRWALAVAAHTVPWLKVTGRGLGIRPSDNTEMLKALGRDPLVIKETRIDAIHGLANLMDEALAAAPRLAAPALILYGRRDEVVPAAPTRRMLRALPADGPQRVAVYDRGFHMLLRDLQAEAVWRDIAHWMAAPEDPLPSGADRAGRAYRAAAE
jgi:alpha-beta hydrolase superfamily lysophospholipase